MNPAFEAFGHRLFGALCTGTYQGLLVTVLVAVALRLAWRANATTRYAVQWLTLVIVAGLPVLHFALTGAARTEANSVGMDTEWATRDARDARFALPEQAAEKTIPEVGSVVAGGGGVEVAAGEVSPALAGLAESREGSLGVSLAVSESVESPARQRVGELAGPNRAGLLDLLDRVRGWWSAFSGDAARTWQAVLPSGLVLLLLGTWGLVAMIRVGALFRQYLRLNAWRSQATVATEELRREVGRLRTEMGIRRAVEVRVADGLTVPMVVGLRRPAILLPADLFEENTGRWEGILRHELAHVARRDAWTNLVQQFVAATLFFHPGVIWLCRRLTVSREIACDDHVLAAMRSPQDYALLLTDFAGRAPAHVWVAAPAAWSKKSQLKERISMILDAKRNASPRLARTKAGVLSTGALLLAGLGLWGAPRLVFAQADTVAGAADASEAAAALAEAGGSDVTSPDAPPTPPLTRSEAKVKSRSGHAVVTRGDSLILDGDGGRLVIAPAPPVPPVPPTPADPAVSLQAVPIPAPNPNVLLAPAPAPLPPVMAHPSTKGDPMERRLARLERLVESLVKQDGKHSSGLAWDENSQKQIAEAKSKLRQQADRVKEVEVYAREAGKEAKARVAMNLNLNLDQELGQILDQVARQVEKASAEAKKAAMAAEAMTHRGDGPGVGALVGEDESKARRHALEEQRRVLQKRLGEIEGQLDRLSDQLDRVDDQLDRAQDQQDRVLERYRDNAERERERVRTKIRVRESGASSDKAAAESLDAKRGQEAKSLRDAAEAREGKEPKEPKEVYKPKSSGTAGDSKVQF